MSFIYVCLNIYCNFFAAVTTQHPPSRIQNDVLVQAPHEVTKFLPPTKLMKRRIQNMRRKHKGAMDDNIEDIKLPNLELPDGSLFNLYDNEKAGDRIMILGARRGLKVVSRSKILLTDGTFKSAPTTMKEKWYQIFVIHAEFMETGEIYPCIFCLMQHRKKENYDEVYREVKRLIGENGWPFQILSGGKMYMDMEPANKSSVKECLNDPAVCVCYFHLSGITNKTVVDLGLKKLVFSSPIFNHHCRMINALATVPLRFVVRACDKLSSYLKSLNSAALPVLDYWEKNLVKGYMVAETRRTVLPKWKIEEWNIYEKIIKKEETSTCKLEAWHQNLDRLLMKAHPTFEEFCQVLMGEWNKIDFEMDLLESGHTRDQLKFKTSTADINRQKRIFNIAMSVNSYHSIVEYLNAMAVASKK